MRNCKTYMIRTYGCQMNELDSEIMTGQLHQKGLVEASSEAEADLILFNTCSIRDLAERKVLGKIGQLGRKRVKRPIIGVTGCMAMAKKDSLFKKVPHIDFILGTNNITDLSEVLDNLLDTGIKQVRIEDKFEDNLDYLIASRKNKLSAYVSIIRGCDKYCTYCVVPYTRGKEVSRPFASIKEEVTDLAAKGCKEITLLGQNVNSYGKDQPDWKIRFHDLIYELDKIDGIERIRFMTSHPVDITKDLMMAIRDVPSACEFIHFPIQAGSSRILKKMHRIYTLEEYLEKVDLLRKIVPNATLGTDIIVGFPTETDEEFEMTYNIFKQIDYSLAFLYTYSPRNGTPAKRWKDDVPEKVKEERLQKLYSLYEMQLNKQMQQLIGTSLEILVTGRNKNNYLTGKSRCFRKVVYQGDDSHIGTLQTVTVTGFHHQTLLASQA